MSVRRKVTDLLQTGSIAYAIRETAIVALGILIAFALNAWWENHKQGRDERVHLRALASDFTKNVAELKALADFESQVSATSLSLLGETAPTDASQLRSSFRQVFSSRRFEPVMGAYEALVNSAGLTLISDDDLRADLAAFAAAIGSRYGEHFSDQLYFEFTREFVGSLEIANDILGRPPSTANYTELLANPRFREFLALRYAAERDVENYYRALLGMGERIKARLDRAVQP